MNIIEFSFINAEGVAQVLYGTATTLGVLGWFSPKGLDDAANQVTLDRDEVIQKINSGLNHLSDATARQTGEGYNMPDISWQDAETARRIANALEDTRDQPKKRGFFR
jgi:hypothetical protein